MMYCITVYMIVNVVYAGQWPKKNCRDGVEARFSAGVSVNCAAVEVRLGK